MYFLVEQDYSEISKVRLTSLCEACWAAGWEEKRKEENKGEGR